MTELRELAVDVSVPAGTPFAEAARTLAATGAAALAVLDGDRVAGLLTTDDVLRGIFPGYLDELEHTAFIEGDAIATRMEHADPVDEHMSDAVCVDVGTGSAHLAELFLHQPSGAIAVVDGGRYVGVVDEAAFVAALVAAAGR